MYKLDAYVTVIVENNSRKTLRADTFALISAAALVFKVSSPYLEMSQYACSPIDLERNVLCLRYGTPILENT